MQHMRAGCFLFLFYKKILSDLSSGGCVCFLGIVLFGRFVGFVCQNPAGQLVILGNFIAERDNWSQFALQVVKRLRSLVHI